MKSVLIAIQPKWCKLIAEGKKTVEVRKTKPKLDVPFKVYIYETRNGGHRCRNCKEKNDCYSYAPKNVGCYNGQGKVIGEFVCDRIDYWKHNWDKDVMHIGDMSKLSCVPVMDLMKYLDGIYDKNGNDKYLYAWYITDLVIYDKPKELSEFYVEGDCDCMNCKKCYWFDKGNGFNVEDDCNLAYKGTAEHKSYKPIIRPPQSWCYVEELGV